MFKYLNLSRLLKQIIVEGQQLKSIIYKSNSLKKNDIPSAYSLLSLVLNNYTQLKLCQQQISQRSKLQVSNPQLILVMLGEFINKGKIIGGGKLKKAIMESVDLIPKIDKNSKINKQTVQLRLRQIGQQYQKIKGIVRQKGKCDKDVPNLFNFNYKTYSQLTKNDEVNLLNSTACVVQSFSSCLPPFLLLKEVKQKWIGRTYDIIDACSAPGNKTIQLAEYLGSNGTVYAFQKNAKRFQLLQSTISKYEVQNVKAENENFLNVIPGDQYSKVRLIMLDPSCSGSGMLTNFTRDGQLDVQSNQVQSSGQQQSFEDFCSNRYHQLSQEQKQRVQKLHNFQLQLLNHAATFKPVRLSYSTCSIYQRQNEDVVVSFLQEHKEYRLKRFKLKNKDSHPGFGELKDCIRMDPRAMRTDGFFVAIFTKTKNRPK